MEDETPRASDSMECKGCRNPVGEGDEYCPHCGDLFLTDLSCQNHPEMSAVSRCLICGKLLCEPCEERIGGRTFCKDHNGYRFVEDWAVIYTADTEWNASLVVGYLKDEGLESVMDSKRDTARALTVGHLAQVNVMVPFDRVLEAEALITDWDEAKNATDQGR